MAGLTPFAFFKVFLADETSGHHRRLPPYCFHCQTVCASNRMICWELSCTWRPSYLYDENPVTGKYGVILRQDPRFPRRYLRDRKRINTEKHPLNPLRTNYITTRSLEQNASINCVSYTVVWCILDSILTVNVHCNSQKWTCSTHKGMLVE